VPHPRAGAAQRRRRAAGAEGDLRRRQHPYRALLRHASLAALHLDAAQQGGVGRARPAGRDQPRRGQARRQPHAGTGRLGGASPFRAGREPATDPLQPAGEPMNAVTDNARANQAAPRRGFRALGAALGAALQWRLLLLWLLATQVPALLAVLPLGDALQAQLGYSVHAGEIASGQRMGLLLQGLGNIGQHSSGVVFTSLLAASVPMLLLARFLPAMIVASLRAGRRLGFAELVAGGCGQYWRMLRMLLWSIVPLGTALVFAGAVMGFASKSTEHAILATDVEN